MNKDLTDIVVIVDRSGSMASIRTDAEGGVNTFIDSQKKLPGQARLTLVQFDTEYDLVHNGVPIKDVPPYTLHPRGSTALNDALAKAIIDTGARLDATPEADRPGLVCVVIVTDGAENSSREFGGEPGRARVREMVKHQQDKYGWQFTFLAANIDAFAASAGYGVQGAVGQYTNSGSGVRSAFAGAHSNVARMRKMSAGGQSVRNAYTEEELKAMSGDDDKKVPTPPQS